MNFSLLIIYLNWQEQFYKKLNQNCLLRENLLFLIINENPDKHIFFSFYLLNYEINVKFYFHKVFWIISNLEFINEINVLKNYLGTFEKMQNIENICNRLKNEMKNLRLSKVISKTLSKQYHLIILFYHF